MVKLLPIAMLPAILVSSNRKGARPMTTAIQKQSWEITFVTPVRPFDGYYQVTYPRLDGYTEVLSQSQFDALGSTPLCTWLDMGEMTEATADALCDEAAQYGSGTEISMVPWANQ